MYRFPLFPAAASLGGNVADPGASGLGSSGTRGLTFGLFRL